MRHPWAALAECCEFLDHIRRPVKESERVDGPYPYFGANGQQGWINDYLFDEPLVLLAEDGGHFSNPERGIAYKINGKTWVNNHAHVLRPRAGVIDVDYLAHALKNKDVRRHLSGSTRDKLTKAGACQIEIPLPPLEEQRRIAAILDKANRITSLQQDARSLVGNLPRSLFLSLFGNPRVNPHSWPECTLGELGRVVTGSTPPSSLDGMFNGAIPFVTPGDLGSGCEPRRSLTEAGALRSRIVRRGSALVCCIGATIGKMDIAQQDSAFNQQVNAVEWGDAVIGEYGIESLRFLKDAIATAGASTTLPILKKSSFEKLRIPVPPIDLQRDYSQRLKAIDLYLEKLQNAAQHGASLRQAVTARAFSGELLA